MPAVHFNPEKTWLDRIDQQYTTGKRVDLSGPYGIPAEHLTEAICLKVLSSPRSGWRNSLNDVPAHLKTPAVCMAAITRSTTEGKYIPPEIWTTEFIENAISTVHCADQLLQYIPDDRITPEICLRCVQNNGFALERVPDRFRSDELCLTAIRSNGTAIEFVPAHLRTIENFRIAAETNPYGAMASIYQHEVSADEYRELCLIAVRRIGGSLEAILKKSPSVVDTEIVAAAIQSDPGAIKHVPSAFVTDALLHAAVTGEKSYHQRQLKADDPMHFSGPLQAIADKWPDRVTELLCLVAVNHYWRAIADVPEALRTVRVILAAVRQDPSAWNWVSDEEKTGISEVALEWVRGDLARIETITERDVFMFVVEALDLEVAA